MLFRIIILSSDALPKFEAAPNARFRSRALFGHTMHCQAGNSFASSPYNPLSGY